MVQQFEITAGSPVVNTGTRLAAVDQAGFLENVKMSRYVRLRAAYLVHKLINVVHVLADRLRRQETENLQPGNVGKSLKHLSLILWCHEFGVFQ